MSTITKAVAAPRRRMGMATCGKAHAAHTACLPVSMKPVPTLDAAWSAVQRVLAVRLDNLGDLLMTTPALAALRESLPHAHLALLTSHAGVALAPHLSSIDEVIAFDAPWVGGSRTTADAEQRLLERLAAARFDAIVVFTVCTQSALPMALLARMAGIPLRLAHCRENPYHLLSHWVRDDERPGVAMRHEVQRQLDLVAHIGARTHDEQLRFELRPADVTAVRALLQQAELRADQRWLVLHPGATAPSRRYPPERFAQAAALVSAASGLRVVVAGAAAEADALEALRAAWPLDVAPPITLPRSLSLGEFAALIAGARLVLCNNSAPAHLAAALGTPVVVAYALTNPQHTPWSVRTRVLSHDVPCRWCLRSVCVEGHHACLRGVPAQALADAALGLIAEAAAA
jgi:lipopolysaccharide heptosyltransferase II